MGDDNRHPIVKNSRLQSKALTPAYSMYDFRDICEIPQKYPVTWRMPGIK